MLAKSWRILGRTVVAVAATLGLALFIAGQAQAAPEKSAGVAGLSHAEALRFGERMYRQGVLPSGEPMLAVVQRDIEVEGTMFSCESCHLRSGLGSVEGKVVVLPTNATELFKPFTSAAEETIPPWETMPRSMQWHIRRPAYDDTTLALALSAGFDPGGREFSWTMPRYQLEDRDMAILVYYLRHLGAAPDPGVTDTTIRFATVIAGDVPKQDRDAMLSILNAHVKARSTQTRLESERARIGPFFEKKMVFAYRQMELSVWELKGPPATWRRQLEDYYRQTPVFALLGGIAGGEWAPIHAFCEENRLPCIFPLTDHPELADVGWYTLYFSKGLAQEGDAAARFLLSREDALAQTPVVQVYRDNRDGRLIAGAFRDARRRLGQGPPVEVVLTAGKSPGADFWRGLATKHPGAVILLWLEPRDLAGLEVLAEHPGRPASLFVAAGLLGESPASVPEAVRSFTLATYPYRLPGELPKHLDTVKSWLKIKKLPVGNLKIQTNAYFIGRFLTNVFMMMESDYYRDFFLDCIDMMNDEVYSIAYYPRLSFGPGQRYASKGCYVVRLGAGANPTLEPISDWVVH